MLYLKPANLEDWEEEFRATKSFPAEDIFNTSNKFANVTEEEFKNEILPKWLDASEGKNLEPGFVPDTHFFLWEDDHIVGEFNFRHYLSEGLKKHGGHIGYKIVPEYRGKGYATKGLALLLKEIRQNYKDKMVEDELYLTTSTKDNEYSLAVMLKNGGYIHHEDDERYHVRIKL